MERKQKWVLGVAVVVIGLYVGSVQATPASGFVGTTLALGRLEEFEVKNRLSGPGRQRSDDDERDFWRSVQRTRGASDLYVQNNVWQPGGSTGWHTHPGHSLIIVTEGTITAYEGDDPSCTPHLYTVGDGFVDPGGDHVHVLRNEGSVEARTIAVQLVPAGATRRVDASGSPACPF
jgi:quercetin dioxygenase-like cupin family protein